ncbi:30S ribosomal protein S31, chloroplastic [Senna tora]|uniref:30S ribosomal protein S31, chloroplastic n=1 Tax=Senna tora TaxID=362788 RepID=A0A834T8Z9_9FABA|nr:30S ribosomal protein S31, chloroplastic [Senna tora]
MATQLLGKVSVSSKPIKFSSVSSFSGSETLSLSIPYTPKLMSVYCGRGDRKTAKGKRFAHSFGSGETSDKKKGKGPPRMPTPPSPRKKDRFDED